MLYGWIGRRFWGLAGMCVFGEKIKILFPKKFSFSSWFWFFWRDRLHPPHLSSFFYLETPCVSNPPNFFQFPGGYCFVADKIFLLLVCLCHIKYFCFWFHNLNLIHFRHLMLSHEEIKSKICISIKCDASRVLQLITYCLLLWFITINQLANWLWL